MTIKNLVIDDLRSFKHPADYSDVVYARNSSEGLEWLSESSVDFLWLDHDLGYVPNHVLARANKHRNTVKQSSFGAVSESIDETYPEDDQVSIDSIVPVVKHIVRFKPTIGTIFVHTSNTTGGAWMMSELKDAGYTVLRVDAEEFFVADYS